MKQEEKDEEEKRQKKAVTVFAFMYFIHEYVNIANLTAAAVVFRNAYERPESKTKSEMNKVYTWLK